MHRSAVAADIEGRTVQKCPEFRKREVAAGEDPPAFGGAQLCACLADDLFSG
jgi:hypothetical protein